MPDCAIASSAAPIAKWMNVVHLLLFFGLDMLIDVETRPRLCRAALGQQFLP
jgi:hypothetical protein